jgi:hypothetical protein
VLLDRLVRNHGEVSPVHVYVFDASSEGQQGAAAMQARQGRLSKCG